MERIRYKYKTIKEGVKLSDIKCPICGNPINSHEVIGDYNWNNKVSLLAQCWSGDIYTEKPRHLFLVEIDNLPIVEITKLNNKKKKNG
jgi:hypothetical protein